MIVTNLKMKIFTQWPAMLALLFISILGFSTICAAEPDPAEPAPSAMAEELTSIITTLVSGNRDSMLTEIKQYTQEISALRDSLGLAGSGLEINEGQRIRFQESIEDLSLLIGEITEELSHLEFQISDNMISLLDESGEGIVINIPEDLDAQVKAGIESITAIVLAQLPDTIGVDPGLDWNWSGGAPEVKPIHHVKHSNVVKIMDGLVIPLDEEIRGNVVVVAGDVLVEGIVEGNLVVVMGDLKLTGDAEILGQVVVVMGEVIQEGQSQLNDLTVIDPLGLGQSFSLESLRLRGKLIFGTVQMLFVLVLLVVLMGMASVPESRLLSVRAIMIAEPATSLGIGFVVATLGHVVVLLLMGMLMASVIGIPLALLLAFALGLFWIVGTGVAALVLGEKLVSGLGDTVKNRWVCVLLGLLLLHSASLLGSVFLVFTNYSILGLGLVLIGACIKATAYLYGLGALISSRLGTKAP